MIDATDENKADSPTSALADENRYLYCIVGLDEDESNDADVEVKGIDDQPVYSIVVDDVAVVVHRCDSLYDSDDFDAVSRWLLAHQRVIDAAGERYGTPLPFQFDTILTGDDAMVRDWLSGHLDEIRDALHSFADTWEYRIHLSWDEETLTELVREEDPELRASSAEETDQTAGTTYLKEKQYEHQLRDARRRRQERVATELHDLVSAHAREVEPASRPAIQGTTDQSPTPFTGISILVHDDQIDHIGNQLDTLAEYPGLEVMFTGPWPPYTFAPAIGEET